ncbi:hypothetical protein D351_01082 [Enterococcus faecalis WKS-26-18-2]|nr:hypothetical protein D351_01082 [Enterococcus faecalis WKS-26-18-2]
MAIAIIVAINIPNFVRFLFFIHLVSPLYLHTRINLSLSPFIPLFYRDFYSQFFFVYSLSKINLAFSQFF